MRLRGYAQLSFADSARLALVRAGERAHSDVDQVHPTAWAVEDRRVIFSLDADATRATFEAHRRLLDELVDEAASGEASLDYGAPEDPMSERWARHVNGGSGEHPVSHDSDSAAAMPTIRTEAS
jgi:hypothetical protein